MIKKKDCKHQRVSAPQTIFYIGEYDWDDNKIYFKKEESGDFGVITCDDCEKNLDHIEHEFL